MQFSNPIFKDIFGLEEVIRGFEGVNSQIKQLLTPISSGIFISPELIEITEQFRRTERITHNFMSAGWVLHSLIHKDFLEEKNAEKLSALLDDYFSTKWIEISEKLNARVQKLKVSDDAKDAFRQALIAHSNGLYKLPVRALFPEIEKEMRELLNKHGERGRPIGQLEENLGSISIPAIYAHFRGEEEAIDFFFHLLSEHTYEGTSRVEAVKLEKVLNRHAALHGITNYSTHRDSVNALLFADIAFASIDFLKKLLIEQQENKAA